MKKTVVFDFDGVIHSYLSGWKGETIIPDPPVKGIKEAISDLRSAGYEVVVVSTRTSTEMGAKAVSDYLLKNDIEVDRVMSEKPPAIVYIDDRAICFDGDAGKLLDKVNKFAPWTRKNPDIKTKKDIELQNKYGDVFTLVEFVEMVEDGDINSYDGHGYLHDGESMTRRSCFEIFELSMSEVMKGDLESQFPYVVWYNK